MHFLLTCLLAWLSFIKHIQSYINLIIFNYIKENSQITCWNDFAWNLIQGAVGLHLQHGDRELPPLADRVHGRGQQHGVHSPGEAQAMEGTAPGALQAAAQDPERFSS